jgi:GntR family transcriptional repressor for pyruvate dehydrogenase complex
VSTNHKTNTLQFQAIAPARAVDEIEAQIRAMLSRGDLKPGDKLPSERDLAARLGVGRNTLREALRSLEYAGIVETRKGASGGAYILPGSSSAIVDGLRVLYDLGAITPQQLTEARVWLSETVVRVACERATEDDLQALEANIEATSCAQSQGEFDARQKLNREFHLVLARITRNPIVISMMDAVMDVMGRFIEEIGPKENRFTLPSRRRLMKHLRNRDADAAVAEMTKYLGRLQSGYLDQWAQKRAEHSAALEAELSDN